MTIYAVLTVDFGNWSVDKLFADKEKAKKYILDCFVNYVPEYCINREGVVTPIDEIVEELEETSCIDDFMAIEPREVEE